jgi:hypothetical protein
MRVGQLCCDVQLELWAEVNLLVTYLDQQLVVAPAAGSGRDVTC